MTAAAKYRPGDRVIHSFLGTRDHGQIVKPAKASALVRFDSGKEERVPLSALRLETAADVAKRDYNAAMQTWRGQRPETKHAQATFSRFGFNADESGAEVRHAKTPDEMRSAAAELLLLADWFAERPVKS